MSSHPAGGGQGSGKVTLTLWVHDTSQAPGTQQQSTTSSSSSSYGVPLANTLSSEIVLSPELLKNELLDVQIGDVLELIKASNANGSNASQGAGSGSTTSSWNGTIKHEERYKRHHRHDVHRAGALNGPRSLPNTESLVFRVERASLANEGSSGQLQVRSYTY
jgi:hypothetical protein